MSLSSLHSLLDRYFNEEELRTLCFHLDVDYDNLGGRGKAANARELVTRLHRQQRLAALLDLARQERPNVAWPDPPPPDDPAAAAALQAQAQTLFERGRALLAPHVRSPAGRDALFAHAFYPAHEWVLDQIDFGDAAAVFLPRCWQTLHTLAPDGALHTRLLLTLKPYCGDEAQGPIDDLIVAWQQLCAAQMAAGRQEAAPPATRPPAADRPGQPALFLSYAAGDAAAAHRLAAALADHGHACRLARAAESDEAAWLDQTAAGLGSAYAVLLLVGAQTAHNRWQRLEYLGARDRQKQVVPVLLAAAAAPPPYVAETPLPLAPDSLAADGIAGLLRRLPPPPPPAPRAWAGTADALRPRLAELAYMDRLKLAELKHVAQYTRLSGRVEVRRGVGGGVRLNPVVARQEFHYAPWRPTPDAVVEQRRFSDAVAELQVIRRAVLLGDPGSGKTTTFYRLAADLVAAALADAAAPVPLMVGLGGWTDAEEPFPAFLRRAAAELGDGLERRLAAGRVALLLDGLNEIPAGQHAAKYAQVRRFLAAHPGLSAWVSCRAQDYPPERDLRLDRVTVAPLDAPRIRAFIHNYLADLPAFGPHAAADLFWQLAGETARARYDDFMARVGPKLANPDRVFWLEARLPDGVAWGRDWQQNWEGWLKERAHPASLLRLATNPYMLFMLLEVYQAHRAVPANRGQLFDQFVDRLLLREGLFAWDAAREAIDRQAAGQALLAGLTALAYEMQRRGAADADAGARTVLPLDEAAVILDARQRYQAASANLLTLGDGVRFAHQLLQEYFVARAMRAGTAGVPPAQGAQAGETPAVPGETAGSAGVPPAQGTGKRTRAGETPAVPGDPADIWPADRWWQPTNWEEATILLAGLYSNNCTPVLDWLAAAQPELAARCIVESGAHTPEETKRRLRGLWLPRLADPRRDPDARARAAVGRALGRVTLDDGTPLDSRPGVGFVVRAGVRVPDIAWGAEVPAGEYEIGGDKAAFQSFEKRRVTIARPYRLARYPITHAQFQCFVEAPDRDDADWWDGMADEERQIRAPRWAYANHPRETVSWNQAMAFCRWLTGKLHAGLLPAGPLRGDPRQYIITLPHEHEWEVAARWPNEAVQQRIYPWGPKFDAAKANTYEGCIEQTTAVGMYPSGKNEALELYDLSGNVWEWCRNRYDSPERDQDPTGVEMSRASRVLRGGSWRDNRDLARAASRNLYLSALGGYGFRVVVVVVRPPSHPDL